MYFSDYTPKRFGSWYDRSMPVTIRDVAKRLNLSITTVSRALDGYRDVSEATRQRVIQTAHEMGYEPNRAARQLRRKRSDTIGYILPARTPRFFDPFFLEFLAGINDTAASYDYDVLISSAPPGEEGEQRIYQHWVSSKKVDGFILNRMRLHDWRVQFLSQAHFPFVTLERSEDDFNYASVELDNIEGMHALIKLLSEKGHTRLAYIGASPDLVIQKMRYLGYRKGLQEAGLHFDEELVAEADLTHSGGKLAATQLLTLDQPPTAILCINDLTAIGAIQAAQALGHTVGKKLAITGFDGLEETENTNPPLTTVTQPVYAIAQEMVRILIAEINGELLPSRRVLIKPELVVRKSSG